MAVLAFPEAGVDGRNTRRQWARFSSGLEYCPLAYPSLGVVWGCHRGTQGVSKQLSRGLGMC